MNGPIQLTPTQTYLESVTKQRLTLSINEMEEPTSSDLIYTEAVFSSGKKSLEHAEKCLAECKAHYEALVSKIKKDPKKHYDKDAWREFWKDPCWKNFEDSLTDVFGLHMCRIQPYDDDPEAKYINAWVYRTDRYPIEGLVTDKGFYDKSHSVIFDCIMSVSLIEAFEPDELLATILHEMGHAIDPALVDIKFGKVNSLSKYLMDRKGADNTDKKSSLIIIIAHALSVGMTKLIPILKRFFMGPKAYEESLLKKVKQKLEKDKDTFNRQNYTEAFADNFARMYGYGPALIRAFKKMGSSSAAIHKSRVKNEALRQKEIASMVIDSIDDEHKTDLHRIHALIKEYDADIKDPHTPTTVKKQLTADRDQLMEIYKSYTNDFEDFQNKCNQLIIDALEESDSKAETKDKEAAKNDDKSSKEESPKEKPSKD